MHEVRLSQFTEARLLVPRLLSDSPRGTISELAQRMAAVRRVPDQDAFVEAVLRRESEIPAVIGDIAIPHARGGAIEEFSFALGLTARGIAWGDSAVVHAVALFAIPLVETNAYLGVVAAFSRLQQDVSTFDMFKASSQPEQMLAFLSQIYGANAGQ